MQTLDRLALIGGVLGREAEKPGDAELLELGEMVAEAAGLRRAAARPRDLIPAVRQRLPGNAGARVDVDHRAAGKFRKIDLRAVGRRERQRRKPCAREMPRCAVILRCRDVGGQDGGIVQGGHGWSPPLE